MNYGQMKAISFTTSFHKTIGEEIDDWLKVQPLDIRIEKMTESSRNNRNTTCVTILYRLPYSRILEGKYSSEST